jgi:tetratricopeptide (TPR) repeat protein
MSKLTIRKSVWSLPAGHTVNRQALAIFKLEANGYFSLAEENFELALEAFQELCRADAQNEDYPVQVACCLDRLERRQEAIAFLKDLHQAKSDWHEVGLTLGILLLQGGHEEEALFVLYGLQRSLPSNPTILEAIRTAELSLANGSNQESRWENEAQQLVEKRNWDGLLEFCGPLLASDSVSAQFFAGLAFEGQGIVQVAKSYYERTLQIDSSHLGAHQRLDRLTANAQSC